jgi:hypothetical protein
MKKLFLSLIFASIELALGQTVVTGTVADIDLSAMPRDGAGIVHVQLGPEKKIKILVPACEGPCDPKLNQYVFTLKKGRSVKLSKSATGEYRIIPE